MVHKCIVPKCGNTSAKWKMIPFPNPATKEIYDMWVERIEGPDLKDQYLSTLRQKKVVCDNHFSIYCRIEDSFGNIKLKRGSLPTIAVPGFSQESTPENSLIKIAKRKICKPRAVKFEKLNYSEENLDFIEQCMLCMTREESLKYYKVDSARIKKSESFLSLLEGIVGSDVDIVNIQTVCSKCRNIVNEFYDAKRRQLQIQQILLGYMNREDLEIDVKTELDVTIHEEPEEVLEETDAADLLEVNFREEARSESELEKFDEEFVKKRKKYGRKKLKIRKQIDTKTNCDICQKTFSRNGALKQHMLTHEATKPYVCEVCGKVYKHNGALKVHLGMHNGINPFTCEYCSKSFTQKIALLRHIPIHTGETPHVCDLCGKRFIHRTSFRIHKLNHAGKKDFKCSVCNFAFLSRSHLNRHLKRHTGEKNFACHVCGRRFAERYNLMCHQKMHATQDLEKPPELSEVFKIEVLANSIQSRS